MTVLYRVDIEIEGAPGSPTFHTYYMNSAKEVRGVIRHAAGDPSMEIVAIQATSEFVWSDVEIS